MLLNFLKKTNSVVTPAILIFFALLITGFVNGQQKDADWYITHAPFKMAEVTLPVFPGLSFSIKNYEAVNDGQTLNTDVFKKDHTQYPMIKASSNSSNFVTASPIYGYDLKNIAITGEGVIDGAGETWRPVKKEKVTAGQWKGFTSSGGTVSNNGSVWWPTKE